MKITFALNDEKFESFLSKSIKEKDDSVIITEPAFYSNMAQTIVKRDMPDILILNESLPSSKSEGNDNKGITFGQLIRWVKTKTNTRIIIICTKHSKTDGFYKALIDLGVYDILSGESVKMSHIVDCVFKPKSLKDVSYLIDMDAEKKEKITPSGDSPVVTTEINKNTDYQNIDYTNENDSPNNLNSTENITTYESGGTTILTTPQADNFIFDFATNDDLVTLGVDSVKNRNVVVYKRQEVANKTQAPVKQETFNGYKDSNILYGPDNPYKRAKIVLFLNVKAGSGCETIATNEAFAIASNNSDRKVLLIDCNIGTSIIYDRLCLPHEGYRLDSMSKNPEVCLDKSKLMFKADTLNVKRFKTIPDNLAFLRMSSDFLQNGNMKKIKDNLLSLASLYDYIILSSKGEYDTDFVNLLSEMSDCNYFVITQDFYELNILINKFKQQKDKIIVNKYVSCDIDTEYISRMFSLTNDRLFTLNYDNGFVKYASQGYAYYPFAKFRTKKQSDLIATNITNL